MVNLKIRENFKNAHDYRVLNRIGGGSYSVVYKAIFQNELVAIKKIDVGSVEREVDILDQCKNSKYIVNMLAFNIVPGYIIFELLGVDFSKFFIKTNEGDILPPLEKLKLMKYISKALNYLHLLKIVHKDVKPENMLLDIKDGKCRAKLVDFGLSQNLTMGKTSMYAGTLTYVSPEILFSTWDQKDTSIDVYSFGVSCWSIFNGVKPHAYIKSKNEMKSYFMKNKSKVLPDVDVEFWKIFRNCISFIPSDRPSCQEIIFEIENEILKRK